MNVSTRGIPLNSSKMKMAIQTTMAIADNVFPRFPTLVLRGVSSSSSWTICAIFPICVFIPIFSTIPIPFPEMMLDSMKTSSSTFLWIASDSPVRDDSSRLKSFTSTSSSRMTTSPTVSSSELICWISLSLLTMAVLTIKSLRLSIAFCERYSWINPIMTFSKTARTMTPASMMSPIV